MATGTKPKPPFTFYCNTKKLMFNNSNKPDVILFTYLANINILAWVAAFKNEINKTKKKEEYEEKGNNGNQITERRPCTEMNGLLNLKATLPMT